MSNYTFTKKNFKKLSSAIESFSKQNPNATHAQFQQMLSNQLFSKPYEEVIATILSDKKDEVVVPVKSETNVLFENNIVPIYYCGDFLFIFYKNEIKAILDSNLLKNNKQLIKSIRLNSIPCDNTRLYHIPFVNNLDYFESNNIDEQFYENKNGELKPTPAYVLYMIDKMGLNSDVTIFDLIENSMFFKFSCIDRSTGFVCYSFISQEKLCGDWFYNFKKEGEDVLCLIIDESDDSFSFSELVSAQCFGQNKFFIQDPNNIHQYQFDFFN